MKFLIAVPSARNSGFETYATRSSPDASSRARTCSPVRTGTVLFMTSMSSAFSSESSSTTCHTADRSASPEYEDGVPTQTKAIGALSRTSFRSRVKWSRPRLRASSSSSPSSWIGMSPAREALDPLGGNVTDDDIVSELGEAGGGDEADPAGAQDSDWLAIHFMKCRWTFRRHRLADRPVFRQGPRGRADSVLRRAMVGFIYARTRRRAQTSDRVRR